MTNIFPQSPKHSLNQPPLGFNENTWQIEITGETDGSLNKNTSINSALGYESSWSLIRKLSQLEEKKGMWYNNAPNGEKDRTDNNPNTISRDAAVDFFKESLRAYDVPEEVITKINISNIVWEEDVQYGADKSATEFRGNKQIDIAEFRNIGIRLENELKIQGHTVNLVDYKNDQKLLNIVTNSTSGAIELKGASDGLLSDYVSLNEALGKDNLTIFDNLVTAQNASKKYKKNDTLSIDAALDFFVEATKAYSVNGISKSEDDIEQIKSALKKADTPKFGLRKGNGQLTFKEFQEAMLLIQNNERAESFTVTGLSGTNPYTVTRNALNMFTKLYY